MGYFQKRLLIVFLFLFAFLCMQSNAYAVRTAYHKTALTGGTTDSLDGINGSLLSNNDVAFVMDSSVVYFYILNSTSGAAESSPNIITPDSSAGDKRWILQNFKADSISVDTISEHTSAAGVTIDSVLLKDGYVNASAYVVTQSATDTLTAAECKNSVISTYGQAAENTQTLPAAAAGLNGMVSISATGVGAFHLKAGASDKIYLNGTALDDGDKASLAAPAIGDCFSFWTIQTAAAAWDWVVVSGVGLLIDGGA